ncbi:hypothetical protein [Nocardia brasiliensis]|uniref:hypothetical protein n=1 Tax=Nocardia brasiliensis TaxID=37326 RepID=UPI0024549BFA|nr:hypothetical protein [Nocardia brasiliensis]
MNATKATGLGDYGSTRPPTREERRAEAARVRAEEEQAAKAAPSTAPSTERRPAAPVRTVTEHETARGRSRDPEEARGRKRTRDAAYAWAAAEHKAGVRLQEFLGEMNAALQRGTAPEAIAEYITEACTRNGIDAGLLPPQIRAAAGLPTANPGE